jgi:hypothetical protein
MYVGYVSKGFPYDVGEVGWDYEVAYMGAEGVT